MSSPAVEPAAVNQGAAPAPAGGRPRHLRGQPFVEPAVDDGEDHWWGTLIRADEALEPETEGLELQCSLCGVDLWTPGYYVELCEACKRADPRYGQLQ